MTGWLPAAALLLPLACTPSEVGSDPLAEASTEVTFASVEQVGPHHMVASIRRTDARPGDERTTDELVELSWQDWDNFQVRRVVDGEATREVLVADGQAWVKVGDHWEERPDAETQRVQLRMTWNSWDSAIGPHRDHVQLVSEGRDVVEGRPATRYRIEMLPDEQRPKNQRWGFQPETASGQVWLDEASAVRLKAQLQTTSRRGDLVRTTVFELQRSNVGGDQGVRPPQ